MHRKVRSYLKELAVKWRQRHSPLLRDPERIDEVSDEIVRAQAIVRPRPIREPHRPKRPAKPASNM